MPSLIQSIAARNTSTSASFAVNIGNTAGNGTVNTTGGNLLVLYTGSTQTGHSFSASDNVNGNWNTDATGTSSAAICTFPNCAGGAITVTSAITGGSFQIDLIFEEWSGVVTASPFDKSAAGSVTSNTSGTSATTPTLSQPNELVLTMAQANTNTTSGFAVQSPFSPSPSSPFDVSPNMFIAAGSQLVNSTAGVNASYSWTTTATVRFVVATYKLQPVQSPLLGAWFAVLP